MTDTESDQVVGTHRYRFDVSALFLSMTLVACVFAMGHWLKPLGWSTTIPFGIAGMLVLLTRLQVTGGAVLGFLVLLPLGGFYLNVVQEMEWT